MKKEWEISAPEHLLALQNEYIRKVAAVNERNEKPKPKRFFISTFGCQMNAHDSEKLAGMLMQMGYGEAGSEEDADLIVYNTCCVRENAENKVYGNLGYLKHRKESNPDLKIILCGCMMQQGAVLDKIRQSYRHVDVIFGTYNLYRFPELLYTHMETGGLIVDVWEEHGEIVEDLPAERKHPFKASINIMYGCNNFCTYCIVPYVRGRERSREAADIIREAEALAADGAIEILLLGQNVNSYGQNLQNPMSFAELLRRVSAVPGIRRIRFMTSHPKDLSDELIEAIAELPNVCHSVHLPFQAGSDDILRRMNRRYSKEDYLALIHKIRSRIPDVGLTTDIIVGFPGESEGDFEDTLDIVRQVPYNGAFTFIYSKRTGTPAASMPDQVPEGAVKDRFNRLLATLNPLILQKNEKQIGKIIPVLVEDISPGNENILTGRADDNSLVNFTGDQNAIGRIVDVKITGCKTFYLIGEQVLLKEQD